MIVVDIESTGLNTKTCSILSIGAVSMEDPTRQFYGECRAWKDCEIQERALKINGFSMEEIKDPTKRSEAELVQDFLDWFNKNPAQLIAGQNVWFDNQFLQQAAYRSRIDHAFSHRIFDLHSATLMHILQRGWPPPADKNGKVHLRSSEIAEYVGIPPEASPHIAITGAKWVAEAFSRLLYGEKLLPDFSEHPIPKHCLRTS